MARRRRRETEAVLRLESVDLATKASHLVAQLRKGGRWFVLLERAGYELRRQSDLSTPRQKQAESARRS